MFSITSIRLIEEYKRNNKIIRLHNLAKARPDVYATFMNDTAFLPTTASASQRAYHVINNVGCVPTCAECGICQCNWVSTYQPQSYSKFCSAMCSNRNVASKSSKAATCLDKYGVSSYSQTEQFKQQITAAQDTIDWKDVVSKKKLHNMETHGVDNTSKLESVTAKRRITNLARYGVINRLTLPDIAERKVELYGTENYTSTDKFKEQRMASMLERYGVEHSVHHAKSLHQKRDTMLLRYGVVHSGQVCVNPASLALLDDSTWLISQHHDKKLSASQIACDLEVEVGTVLSRLHKFDIEIKRYPHSGAEQEILSFIQTMYPSAISGDRKLLKGQELDIVVPELKLAIEYCGLYWHSDAHASKGRSYHKRKLDMCTAMGYRLITIFEDEWVHTPQIVKSKLISICKRDTSKAMYARQCSVVSVGTDVKSVFFNKYHIQGTGPSSINYGLMHNGEVVAVMGFINKGSGVYDLNRFATSMKVTGGFTKLLSHFKKTYQWKEIYSFADLRWSVGSVYVNNGFSLDKVLPVDYYYVNTHNVTRIHKFNFRHVNLQKILGAGYDSTKSETQNTRANNWFRIWNCGLLRYHMLNVL